MRFIQMLLITCKAAKMNRALVSVVRRRGMIGVEQMQMQMHRVHERASEQGDDRDRGHSNSFAMASLDEIKYRVELASATNWRAPTRYFSPP